MDRIPTGTGNISGRWRMLSAVFLVTLGTYGVEIVMARAIFWPPTPDYLMTMMRSSSALRQSRVLKMNRNRAILALDPPMFMSMSLSLRLHPVLPTFRQKFPCKIHLHRPSSPPLEILEIIQMSRTPPIPREKLPCLSLY